MPPGTLEISASRRCASHMASPVKSEWGIVRVFDRESGVRTTRKGGRQKGETLSVFSDPSPNLFKVVRHHAGTQAHRRGSGSPVRSFSERYELHENPHSRRRVARLGR